MSLMRFLLDEDTWPVLAQDLQKKQPLLDIVYVAGPGGPPKSTPDPDLLVIAEAQGRAIITRDKGTMPGHAADHVAAGRHTWGVFLRRPGFSLQDYANAILMLWSASEAEEWQDQVEWIPF